MRKVIDCGFAVAVIELTEDRQPMLTLMTPANGEDDAQSFAVWGDEGLHNLRDALAEFLDEFDQGALNEPINPQDLSGISDLHRGDAS
jgi:hypothetical protein